MQMNIHVALSLTAAANATIAGRDIGPYWPGDPNFVFTRSFTFQDKSSGAMLAKDPNRWLESLKNNVQGVWLHCVKRNENDMMENAFANGGRRWILETVNPGGSELWEGNDFVSDRRAADDKIWSTIYWRIATGSHQQRPVPRSIAKISADLAETLGKVAAFADEVGLDNFAKLYRDALAVLETGKPEAPRPYDDFPTFARLAPDAAALYQAAVGGWQFGGMGAWNDASFEGGSNDRYQRLTRELFERLCEALVAVANTTFKPS